MKLQRDIKYINREFNDFVNVLKTYAKTYFPNTYNDFTPESLGNMFMEMDAYVGDILSFYLDNQIQETFPQYSRIIENLFKHAYSRGYKPKVTTPSHVEIEIFQEVPSIEVGGEYFPNLNASLYIPPNTLVRSSQNPDITFLIESSIDFSFENSFDITGKIISQVDGSNNPTHFLLKKKRKAISAQIVEEEFTFGENTPRFASIEISNERIIKILDVVDSDGNIWYEVNNLAQDLIYTWSLNENTEVDDSKYILNPQRTKRKFVSRFIDPLTLKIEFGAGNYIDYENGGEDINILPNPLNTSELGKSYDPLNFLHTGSYGIVPKGTILTIRYLIGGGIESNVESNQLTLINKSEVNFSGSNTTEFDLNTILETLTVNNFESASGGGDGETLEELRINMLNHYNTQLRTVSNNDYIIRTLTMPSEFGAIAKAYCIPSKINENQEAKSLNLYVLSYDVNKKLKETSSILKSNLGTYLYEFKSIGDVIYIKDAKIVNIGVNYEIVVRPNYNTNDVIFRCNKEIQSYFEIEKWNINQPILLNEIKILIDKVEGVQTVNEVNITNKIGSGISNDYSNYSYDLKSALVNNTIYPSLTPMIFEVKFPLSDIKGRATTF